MGYSFQLAARVLPTDRILHTMTFVTPVMEHWLEWLYDVRHMAKDNLDNERGNQLPLLLAIHFKVFLYSPTYRQDTTYHDLWYTRCYSSPNIRMLQRHLLIAFWHAVHDQIDVSNVDWKSWQSKKRNGCLKIYVWLTKQVIFFQMPNSKYTEFPSLFKYIFSMLLAKY